MESDEKLLNEIKKCQFCKNLFPHDPNPVLNFSKSSKILIIGQAPGLKVHKSGIPWDDSSGDRLRNWLGVSPEEFYNKKLFGIIPMAFCYPGKGKSGDLPPRPECAEKWMSKLMGTIDDSQLILLIGSYSQRYFLGKEMKKTLTETVKSWKTYLPEHLVLPHPSPRNNIWLKKNEWFEENLVPELKTIIREAVK